MKSTVVGLFDDREKALSARQELLATGFSERGVALRVQDAAGSTATVPQTHDSEGGFGGWLRSIFSDDDSYGATYNEAVRRGHYLVTVEADGDAEYDRAATVMERWGSSDIDEHAEKWRRQGWSAGASVGQTRVASAGGAESNTIPIVEEALRVGKRQVLRGGVRVFTRIVERPVQESVQLREEHAEIHRHKVDRPATEADFGAMREGTIEIRETVEEPVVSKTARVVEEIDIGKSVTERTETIRDTVRHTEVDVERIVDEPAMARSKVESAKKSRPR